MHVAHYLDLASRTHKSVILVKSKRNGKRKPFRCVISISSAITPFAHYHKSPETYCKPMVHFAFLSFFSHRNDIDTENSEALESVECSIETVFIVQRVRFEKSTNVVNAKSDWFTRSFGAKPKSKRCTKCGGMIVWRRKKSHGSSTNEYVWI